MCLLSPAIAQRTGVNKSVSFARWQQGAGAVPRLVQLKFLPPIHQEMAARKNTHAKQ